MATKKNDENKDINENSEEHFGLPDLEFEELDDLDKEEESDLEEVVSSPASAGGSGGSSQSFTRIIIIGLVGAVALSFLFLYWHNQNPSASETRTAEVTEAEGAEAEGAEAEGAEEVEGAEGAEGSTDGAEVESTPAPTQQQAAPTPRPVRTQLAASTPGQVTTITSATGRYYIIVASFIDDDMANDHANKLASQGAAVKIVNPFGDKKYWRVSVADYGALLEAVNGTNQLKPQYGDDIWTVKY